ncbi:primosomal replication protein N [Methylobacterium radiotolerans]|nr:primosomal replication protein N [Methylobacterium radiotolerans]
MTQSLKHKGTYHGFLRKTIAAVALGDLALLLKDTALGSELLVQGFLAPTRKDSVKIKLHLQQARKIKASAGRDPQVA